MLPLEINTVVISSKIEYQTSSQTAATEGQQVTLSCSATGFPSVSWRWSKDGVRLANTASSLVISNARWQDDGEYTCEAYNSASSDQTTVALTVGMISQNHSFCVLLCYIPIFFAKLIFQTLFVDEEDSTFKLHSFCVN